MFALRKAREITDKAEAESRDLKPAEQREVDDLLAQAAAFEADHDFLSKVDASGKRKTSSGEPQNHGTPTVACGWYDVRSRKPVRVYGKADKLADPRTPANGLGDFVAAAIRDDHDRMAELRNAATFRAAGSTGDNSTGGFLVPNPLWRQAIDEVRNILVLTRMGARTVPMESGTLSIARVSGDPTVVASKAENDTITASDVTFDQINLVAHTMAVRCVISRELAEDSINAAEVIQQAMLGAMAQTMDAKFLRGSGSGEPLGVVNQTGVQETSSVGSITYDNILNAIEDLADYNFEPTGFVATPLLNTALMKLKVNGEANHYATPPAAIRELQRLTSKQVATGELYIGDWSRVLIGIRQEPMIEIDRSGDYFDKHQVGIKITMRGDAHIERGQALCKLTGATA